MPSASSPLPCPPLGSTEPPVGTTAVLVFADGTGFWGRGIGARGVRVGEVCFNTSMTGYQEILTDPSYAGQIITFTFPHIGNVGTNRHDVEAPQPAALGLVLRATPTAPSNYRAEASLDDWLGQQRLVGIAGVDTRHLARRIRDAGAPIGALCHVAPGEPFDVGMLQAEAQAWGSLEGMDLAARVTCVAPYEATEGLWDGFAYPPPRRDGSIRSYHVVAIDYGIKRNILRHLVAQGFRVTVVPATASAAEILERRPDGVFLSNGPGDPAATGIYAVPTIRALLDAGIPLFGICLGHQMLALALGGRTEKMHLGHRGGNHPVVQLASGKVDITSQNHGFCVAEGSLPPGVEVTHRSLFDHSIEGLAMRDRPVCSVQFHPESSPGPQDSHDFFMRFRDAVVQHAQAH